VVPLPSSLFDFNLAFVRFSDNFGDCQSQDHPTVSPGAGFIDTVETLEDMRRCSGGMPMPVSLIETTAFDSCLSRETEI